MFDATARGFPGLVIEKRRDARVYRVAMDVPHYEPRRVEIRFEDWRRRPRVFVDGPSSPHRYRRNGEEWLCMWHPDDPPEQRWVFKDGLLALLNQIQAHLFREAWWRETGEWPGLEAPHAPVKEPEREEVEGSDHSQPDTRRR